MSDFYVAKKDNKEEGVVFPWDENVNNYKIEQFKPFYT